MKASTIIMKIVVTLFFLQSTLIAGVLALMSVMATSINLKVWSAIFIFSCLVFIIGVFFCWKNTKVSIVTFGSVIYAFVLYFAVNYLETGASKINIQTSQITKPLTSPRTTGIDSVAFVTRLFERRYVNLNNYF